MEKRNIIIADDSEVFRLGVRNVLQNKGYTNIEEASGSVELFHILNEIDEKPELILLDVKFNSLSSLSGIEITRKIRSLYPEINIIMLTAFDEKDILKDALEAGVSGFLPKEAFVDEIIESIETVLQGKNYLGKTIPFDSIQYAFRKKYKKYEKLTKTEKKIFNLICKGMVNKDVASSLNVSIHTIETHKSNIKNKMEIKSDVDFLAIAIKEEITEIMDFYKLNKKVEV